MTPGDREDPISILDFAVIYILDTWYARLVAA